jgi:hypothetical protein
VLVSVGTGAGVLVSASAVGELVEVEVAVGGELVWVVVAPGGGIDAEGVGCTVGKSVRQESIKIRIKSTMKTRRMAVL